MQELQVRSLGREDSPGEGNGNPLQYSCLGHLREMDRGAWWATVHGVTKESDRDLATKQQQGSEEFLYRPLASEASESPGRLSKVQVAGLYYGLRFDPQWNIHVLQDLRGVTPSLPQVPRL